MTTIECVIDYPRLQDARPTNGFLEVTGWAAATSRIHKLKSRLGDGPWIPMRYGYCRRDVEAARPHFPNSRYSGFSAHLPAPDKSASLELEIEIETEDGGRSLFTHTLSLTPEAPGSEQVNHEACPACHSRNIQQHPECRHGNYNLCTCHDCGFGFVNPMPGISALKDYYDNRYWHVAGQRPSSNAEHYDTGFIHELIQRFKPDSRRLFEIGCGPGTLLAGLKRRGFEVRGQDFSSEAASIAEQTFGIDVRVAPLSNLPPWDCDVIILRHVIEHSPSACDDLESAAKRLQPGGLLILITPNLDSLLSTLLGASWEWYVPPAHLSLFSPRSLEALSTRLRLDLRLLTTRRGDGDEPGPTLDAFLHYNKTCLPVWKREQLKSVLSSLRETPNSDKLLASLGIGNEVIAVMAKPSV